MKKSPQSRYCLDSLKLYAKQEFMEIIKSNNNGHFTKKDCSSRLKIPVH